MAMMKMRVPMSDLRLEYEGLKPAIDGALRRVIESGSFVMGEELAAFEEEFARYCGTRYSVGVGSGSAALHLALLACGVGSGDEVITVPNTDIPTTMAITHCGAAIVWVDIDPQTFTIDPGRIEEKISPRTKALLPVHLFGHPAEMDAVTAIARRHGLVVIEDAALATGAEYRGRTVGGIGDVGCFSLAPTKILGAYGDAGIVTTNSREIAERVKVLRNYGHDLSMDDRRGLTDGIRTWKLIAEGFNERLDALQAAVLRAKLPTLEDRIAKRRAIAERYGRQLSRLDLVTPFEAPGVRHVYRGYPLLVRERARTREHLAERGIATQVYYAPPLHLQPAYARLGLRTGAFAVAEDVARHLLSVPLFPEMTDGQVDEVVAALEECLPVRPHLTARGQP
jgi:dTDP-4-amino-4,6-dideoxygalactose transaminase